MILLFFKIIDRLFNLLGAYIWTKEEDVDGCQNRGHAGASPDVLWYLEYFDWSDMVTIYVCMVAVNKCKTLLIYLVLVCEIGKRWLLCICFDPCMDGLMFMPHHETKQWLLHQSGSLDVVLGLLWLSESDWANTTNGLLVGNNVRCNTFGEWISFLVVGYRCLWYDNG